jgi:hypothetical protein
MLCNNYGRMRVCCMSHVLPRSTRDARSNSLGVAVRGCQAAAVAAAVAVACLLLVMKEPYMFTHKSGVVGL